MAIISNVVRGDAYNKVIDETMVLLRNTLSSSLGPFGKNSFLEEAVYNHPMTKDGYSILKDLVIVDDQAAKMIVDKVKTVSRHLVTTVGDGTTSAVLIAATLYKSLAPFIKQHNIPSSRLLELLKGIRLLLEKEIVRPGAKYIKKVKTPKDTYKVAMVSTNYNKEISEMIKSIYTSGGMNVSIDFTLSKSAQSYYDMRDGYNYSRGYIDPFIYNPNKLKSITLKNPLVVMMRGKMTSRDMDFMITQMETHFVNRAKQKMEPTPLIFIAEKFDYDIIDFVNMNLTKAQGHMPLYLVDTPALRAANYSDRYDDLAAYLNAKVIDLESPHVGQVLSSANQTMFGQCEEVIITEKYTRFVRPVKPEGATLRIKLIDEIMATTKEPMDLAALRLRISDLTGKNAIIYIGGFSEEEKRALEYLVDDAILACKSAVKSGIVVGGNLTYARILFQMITNGKFKEELSKLSDELSLSMKDITIPVIEHLYATFCYPMQRVLSNKIDLEALPTKEIVAYVNQLVQENKMHNVMTGEDEPLNNCDIVNSVDTEVEITRSSFSIIGLLLSSNQFMLKVGPGFNPDKY